MNDRPSKTGIPQMNKLPALYNGGALAKRQTRLAVEGVPSKPTIYFAGKISPGDLDWRGEVLGDYSRPAGECEPHCLWDADYRLDQGTFVSCDHGCAHYPYAHGALGSCLDLGGSDTQSSVYKVNIERMARADMIFAYLDAPDAYGTLFELGVAAQMGKPVVGGFKTGNPKLFKDLWYCRQPMLKVYRGSIEQTWRAFCEDFIPNEVRRFDIRRSIRKGRLARLKVLSIAKPATAFAKV